MRFEKLIQGMNVQSQIPLESEVRKITADSRQVEQGTLFVARVGGRSDGHDHAKEALEKGAVGVVLERDLGLPGQVMVPSTKKAYGLLCAAFYGNSASRLRLIGVTGTNGKTTVSHIIFQLLRQAGEKVGLIGTIESRLGDFAIPARYTTPDPLELHALLARMEAAGCTSVVMEVSSHGLDQERLSGCHFAVGIFTNLTQDHLDYHGTMERYFLAKARLANLSDQMLVNEDDPYGRRLLQWIRETGGNPLSFGLEKGSDYWAKEIVKSSSGVHFTLEYGKTPFSMDFPMPGDFSVSNALAAIGCVHQLGISLEQIKKALPCCEGVKGRTEVIRVKELPFTVIRDYAHAPDGLLKILSTIRGFTQGRIVLVFGSAGERDVTKRPEMGRIAAMWADAAVITSDNPRSEDETLIIEGVAKGFAGSATPFWKVPDRLEAIRLGMSLSLPGDVLLLAGKGHEEYQVLSYGTIAFDEAKIVKELAQGKGV